VKSRMREGSWEMVVEVGVVMVVVEGLDEGT
jgi:hypothetical protein